MCGHNSAESVIVNSEKEEVEDNVESVTYKTDESLKDQQSTGRKRAAKIYPLDSRAYCEWAGQKNVGGGSHPIDGCGVRPETHPNLQQCRHHGPDKNTLNNDPGNVHRICTPCHNEWHSKNDKDYLPGQVIGD